MNVNITPRPLGGVLNAIPSKSDVHRILICAALAKSKTEIAVSSLSDDIMATISCIKSMGAETELKDGIITVKPIWENKNDKPIIDCRESGSTLRFLLPVVAAVCENPTLTGRGRLPERPTSPLKEEMEKNGINFSANMLPFTLSGRLKSGTYTLAGNISSQFISGLLFALPLLDGESKIILTSPLESIGYVNMTLSTLSKFGIKIDAYNNEYRVRGNQTYITPEKLYADGDWSNSAFWLSAGALGESVSVNMLDSKSHQGDKEIISVLKRFGASVECRDTTFTVKKNKLTAINLDCTHIPDLVPIISAVAALADGTTVLTGVKRLRIKESDRLKAICDTLTSLGGEAYSEDDKLIIIGKEALEGGIVNGYNDHRIVMTAAICALKCKKNVLITGCDAVNKSYPDFFEHYKIMGGVFDVL